MHVKALAFYMQNAIFAQIDMSLGGVPCTWTTEQYGLTDRDTTPHTLSLALSICQF